MTRLTLLKMIALLLALGMSQASAQSQWVLRNPLPTNEELVFVTSGGGTILALGLKGGILTSPDGVAWTRRVSGVQSRLNGAAWTGTQWVVVGDSGKVLTSPDGVDWRLSSSGAQSLYAVAWTGSRLVATGYQDDRPKILTSVSGDIWAPSDPRMEHGNLMAIVWTGKLLVAVGDTIMTSPDGIVWTPRSCDTHSMFRSVAWSGSRLVAVGWVGAPQFSTDGITWNSAENEELSINSVAWTGERFVGVGGDQVLASVDGSSWEAQAGCQTCYSLTWSGGLLIGVGGGTRAVLRTSPDGTAWTSRVIGTQEFFKSVIWTGLRYVAVAGNPGNNHYLTTSADGRTWDGSRLLEIPGVTIHDMHATIRSGGRILATGRGLLGGESVNFLFRSDDGLNWTAHLVPAYFETICWTGSRYLAAANDKIFHSPDGVAWDSVGLDQGFPIKQVIWTGEQAVAVSTAQIYRGRADFSLHARISTSPDGLQWTLRYQDTTTSLTAIAWTGKHLVAAGGSILTSTDGREWTGRREAAANIIGMIWTGNRLVALGYSGSILSSPDGLEWSEHAAGLGGMSLTAIAASGGPGVPGTLVAVGANGTILSAEEGTGSSIRTRNVATGRPRVRQTSQGLQISVPGFPSRSDLRATLISLDGRRSRTLSGRGGMFLFPLEGMAAGPYFVEVTGADLSMAVPFRLDHR